MDKIFGVLTAILILPSAFAAVQKGSDLTFGAEFRFRDVYEMGPTLQGTTNSPQNSVRSRIKFNTAFRASERFTAYLSLMHSAKWGAKNLYLSRETTGDSAKGLMDGTSNADNVIVVQEAYGAWMVNDSFMLRFGRGSFTMGDGTVISANDYQDFPYAFEGILGLYEWEFMRLSVWAAKFASYTSNFTVKQSFAVAGTTPSSGSNVANPEANAYGFSIDWKILPAWLKMANIHVIRNQKDTTPGNTTVPATVVTDPRAIMGQETYRYGISIGGDYSRMDYQISYNAVTGNYLGTTANANSPCQQASCRADSWMVQGVLGYSLSQFRNSRFFVVYHMDSGTKDVGSQTIATYDPYFYELHNINNGGLMDLVTWGNLTYFSAGYSLTPVDQFDTGVLYTLFRRTETGADTNPAMFGRGIFNPFYAVTGTPSTSKDIGQEVDVYGTKKYDGGFEVQARVGMFFPGNYAKDVNSAHGDSYTQVFLQGKMAF